MLLLNYLVAIVGMFSFATQATTTLARCNADNCYRALFPCPSPSAVSSASVFCATITAGGTTATNFPTRATAACGTVPGRYLSACACGPTCTPTPCAPSGGLLANGDFECGIGPWTVEVPDGNASAGITSAGANSGRFSFEEQLLSDRPLQDPVVSARIKSVAVPVQRGVPCKLTFSVWFDNIEGGFVGVMFNGVPARTVDAADSPGWGVWKTVSVDYTPTDDTVQVMFEFLHMRVKSVVRLDSVVFDYLH